MFEQAGITKPPTSNDEWIDAIAKLKTKFGSDPDFQALYMPGQNWYSLLSFIWDNGGDIAKADGKKFKATLDSAEAKAGLEFYKKLVDTSGTKAPKDADEAKPQQATVYGAGKVAMMIGLPWELPTAAKTDPSLTDKTGAFAIPSKTAGQSAPVFLGGSNLAIPANSKNAAAAKEYIKLLSSAEVPEPARRRRRRARHVDRPHRPGQGPAGQRDGEGLGQRQGRAGQPAVG